MVAYKVPKSSVILIYGLLGFWTLVCLVLFIGVITAPDRQAIGVWALSIWLGLLAWSWYRRLRMALEIRWSNEESLEFRSAIGSTKVNIMGLISIEEAGALLDVPIRSFVFYSFIKFRHSGGTIRLLSRGDGLKELLSRVECINPAVEISVFKDINP